MGKAQLNFETKTGDTRLALRGKAPQGLRDIAQTAGD